ncbi:MAG: peptidoglycan-binding protein [Ekhidna sp.]
MKKLLLIILIITLPLIAFFQYKNYRRFHPPVNYEFSISNEIDPQYHDQGLLDEYYTKAIEIGSFARIQWRTNGFDVRFPNENIEAEVNASRYYNQLVARVNNLQNKLIASSELKNEGLSNGEIRLIESGYAKNEIPLLNNKDEIIQVSFGDQSRFVWKVQKQLIAKGYNHALDGLFGIDTQNAITTFQQDNQLYPSGSLDEETFEYLFMN